MIRKNDFDIYEDAVERCLYEYYSRFCKDESDIDHFIYTSAQNTFHGAMKHLYKSLFKGNVPMDGAIFRIDVLERLLELYMDLCSVYDKVITVVGYQRLTGLSDIEIYSWAHNDVQGINGVVYDTDVVDDTENIEGGYNTKGEEYRRMVRYKRAQILKSLVSNRESSTASKMTITKGSVLGLIAIQNHYHAWSTPGISYADNKSVALSAAELPQLSDGGSAPALPDLSGGDPGEGL